jgi:hypothetical protein
MFAPDTSQEVSFKGTNEKGFFSEQDLHSFMKAKNGSRALKPT